MEFNIEYDDLQILHEQYGEVEDLFKKKLLYGLRTKNIEANLYLVKAKYKLDNQNSVVLCVVSTKAVF